MSKPLKTVRRTELLRRNVLLVAGLLLLLPGIVALIVGSEGGGSQSFGWFAYAPIPEDSEPTLWSTRSATFAIVGATSAAVGLVAVAGSIGYRAGRQTAA